MADLRNESVLDRDTGGICSVAAGARAHATDPRVLRGAYLSKTLHYIPYRRAVGARALARGTFRGVAYSMIVGVIATLSHENIHSASRSAQDRGLMRRLQC